MSAEDTPILSLADSVLLEHDETKAKRKLKFIIASSNKELGQSIISQLNIDPVNIKIKTHSNGEIKIQIEESIRGKMVYILASGTQDIDKSVNDYIMELILIIDACRRSSASKVSVILSCFPYARSDKKDDGRTTIAGEVMTRMIQCAGADRIVSIDLHANQIQGFTTLPFDNLEAIKLLINYLQCNYFAGIDKNEKYVLVSPDAGGAKRVQMYAELISMKYVIMSKQRDYTKESVVLKSILIGDKKTIAGKTAILIDDMIDTMGTMISAATELHVKGITNVIVMATHGVLSGLAIERINSCELVTDVIVTNTLPQKDNMEKCPKLKVVDIAALVSQVILRLESGRSVSSLFKF